MHKRSPFVDSDPWLLVNLDTNEAIESAPNIERATIFVGWLNDHEAINNRPRSYAAVPRATFNGTFFNWRDA